MKHLSVLAALLVAAIVPNLANAGVFVALEKDRIDPAAGEHPTVVMSFDQKLSFVKVTVTAETGGDFTKTWTYKSVSGSRDYTIHWKQPPGEVEYLVSVEMETAGGEVSVEELYLFVAAVSPITASIPANSVDIETRTFDLVTNHPPARVELEVMDDRRKIIGKSTFLVTEAEYGKPVKVTWEQHQQGNIFRISATVYDIYDYWASAEIIPWNLQIPHEDVVFDSGSHEILEYELPKLEPAWREIVKAVDQYGEWVQCSLYIAGYTDTVGSPSSNQGLSERRALSLARFFQNKGAEFPIYYRGYGESVLALETEDSVDEELNRRALYVITAGPAPRGKDTPGGNWKRLR